MTSFNEIFCLMIGWGHLSQLLYDIQKFCLYFLTFETWKIIASVPPMGNSFYALYSFIIGTRDLLHSFTKSVYSSHLFISFHVFVSFDFLFFLKCDKANTSLWTRLYSEELTYC